MVVAITASPIQRADSMFRSPPVASLSPPSIQYGGRPDAARIDELRGRLAPAQHGRGTDRRLAEGHPLRRPARDDGVEADHRLVPDPKARFDVHDVRLGVRRALPR